MLTSFYEMFVVTLLASAQPTKSQNILDLEVNTSGARGRAQVSLSESSPLKPGSGSNYDLPGPVTRRRRDDQATRIEVLFRQEPAVRRKRQEANFLLKSSKQTSLQQDKPTRNRRSSETFEGPRNFEGKWPDPIHRQRFLFENIPPDGNWTAYKKFIAEPDKFDNMGDMLKVRGGDK